MRSVLKSARRFSRKWLGPLVAGLLSLSTILAHPQVTKNFSGVWSQDNERCQPTRKGDVRLKIEDREPALTVETTISGDHGDLRHAMQQYTTDGRSSITTGADGDEFQTSVARDGMDFIFSIQEHEDGRILKSRETWSLVEEGATLERIREPAGGERQILFYRRVSGPEATSSNKDGTRE